MACIKIDNVARVGTEEYLFLLLACESISDVNGEISLEMIDQYLENKSDEASFFDPTMIQNIKRKIRQIEKKVIH